jgi:hypothetical protein
MGPNQSAKANSKMKSKDYEKELRKLQVFAICRIG